VTALRTPVDTRVIICPESATGLSGVMLTLAEPMRVSPAKDSGAAWKTISQQTASQPPNTALRSERCTNIGHSPRLSEHLVTKGSIMIRAE